MLLRWAISLQNNWSRFDGKKLSKNVILRRFLWTRSIFFIFSFLVHPPLHFFSTLFFWTMLIYHATNIRLFVSLRFDTQHKSFPRSKRRNTDVLCSVSSQTEFYSMKYIHVVKLSNRRWNIFLSSFHRDNLLIDYINQCGKHLNHRNASLKSIKLIYYYVRLCEWYFITGKRKRKIFTILLKPAEKRIIVAVKNTTYKNQLL